MRVSSIVYSLKQGFKNIIRNKMFSLASIATMAACIFLFGLFYTMVFNFQHIVKQAETGVSVSVFFNDGISQEQITAIGDEISKRVEVSKYEYISAEEALNRFINDTFNGNQ
ncbi:cell division protein FtsX, partial [Lachnotalea glycerini]